MAPKKKRRFLVDLSCLSDEEQESQALDVPQEGESQALVEPEEELAQEPAIDPFQEVSSSEWSGIRVSGRVGGWAGGWVGGWVVGWVQVVRRGGGVTT